MKTLCRNRQVATAVGLATTGVLITSDNPIDLWYVGNIPATVLGVLATAACIAIAVRPQSSRTLPFAGIPVLYWLTRALDAAWDASEGERTYAAAIIHLGFSFILYNYWSLAIRHEAMSTALRVGPPRGAN